MANLSIRRLADIVGGQLELGTMPPLGGDMEPVGRIVTASHDVLPGDLFWGLEHNANAEEAMLRNAQGTVVAQRHIEPWAGQFSIRVTDAHHALLELGQWARHRYTGTVIGAAGGPQSHLTANLLHQILQHHAPETQYENMRGDAATSAAAMLNWNDESDCAVLDLGSEKNSELAQISHLCCPEIIAIYSHYKLTRQTSPRDRQAIATEHSQLLATLNRDTIVVLNSDDLSLREAARNYSLETISVGHDCDADVKATNVCCRHGQVAFDVDSVRFQFPHWGRQFLAQAMTAIVIGRLLSVPSDVIQDAARNTIQPTQCTMPHSSHAAA